MRNRRIQCPAEVWSTMMPSREGFEAGAGFGKQLLGHCQIALRSSNAGVAEIRRQLGEKIVQVGVTAIPRSDTVNGRRVPEVVHPRLVAGTPISSDICDLAKAAKCDAKRCPAQGRAVTVGKDPALGSGRIGITWPCNERPHHRGQAIAQRDDARLEELRPPNVYQRLLYIDVFDLKTH